MTRLPLLQVDAFADRPFAGNPAAVCILDEERDPAWMQRVAAEMNLSETAFVLPTDAGFALRWFTPTVEVDLCGHATLASAHALWQENIVAEDAPIRFDTRSGRLTCYKDGRFVHLDFPAASLSTAAVTKELVEALGVEPTLVRETDNKLLALLESDRVLRNLTPDFSTLAGLPCDGVIVTARSADAEFDFVSRFFAPAIGINEDPVTGAAHCCLGPFWAARLGTDAMTAYQASARGGVVKLRVSGERVDLGGMAVTVSRGSLLV